MDLECIVYIFEHPYILTSLHPFLYLNFADAFTASSLLRDSPVISRHYHYSDVSIIKATRCCKLINH
jgi:hypothetical protein